MRILAPICAAALVAVPASAQDFVIDLLPGHPIYDGSKGEAGVVMALSITPGEDHTSDLEEACEELRIAAGLGPEDGNELRLEVIFVSPHRGMAVEGYYLPAVGSSGNGALVPGNGLAREALDGIVMRAGIPARVLDEAHVEHQVSCELGGSIWHLRWDDVRLIGGEEPEAVIERAHRRFIAVHDSIVEYNAKGRYVQKPGERSGPVLLPTKG